MLFAKPLYPKAVRRASATKFVRLKRVGFVRGKVGTSIWCRVHLRRRRGKKLIFAKKKKRRETKTKEFLSAVFQALSFLKVKGAKGSRKAGLLLWLGDLSQQTTYY